MAGANGAEPCFPIHLGLGMGEVSKPSKSLGLAIPSQLRGVIFTHHQRRVLGYYCSVGMACGLAGICLERANTAPDHGWRYLHSCAGDVDRPGWASSTNTGHRPGLDRRCAVLGLDNYTITQDRPKCRNQADCTSVRLFFARNWSMSE
jgi:hypothetical protein